MSRILGGGRAACAVLVNAFRYRFAIGWVAGWVAALTVNKWTHPGWWGVPIACGIALFAASLAVLVGLDSVGSAGTGREAS